jgi:hypothetical protein
LLSRRKLWLVLALAGAMLLSLTASLPTASADACTVTVTLVDGQTLTFNVNVAPGTPISAMGLSIPGPVASESESCQPSTSSTTATTTASPTSTSSSSSSSSSSTSSSSSSSSSSSTFGVPNFFIDKFRIPPFLLPIYQAAGIQYGIRWEVLAAINEIETDYGRNLNVSSAGALGWMQFMPSTWKMYGVDANKDGKQGPVQPGRRDLRRRALPEGRRRRQGHPPAIFAYNHADWYVDS